MKIKEPRELLGKIIWDEEKRKGVVISIIELAEYIFKNPDKYKYVSSFKLEDIEVLR